jgi:hypothetical protein
MAEPWPPATVTAILLAPPDPAVIEERGAVMEAAKRIPRALADLAVPRLGGSTLRVTDHHVRTALAPEIPAITETPFAWSPRTTRRTLGLAAVRTLASGEARSPIEGVRLAVAVAVRSVRDGERSAASMDRWLSGLAPAGLAAVEADAVTWATRLWCALDWNAFEEIPLIGRDRWWNSPHSSLLAIRSRVEVRSVTRDHNGNAYSTNLVVLGGRRRATVRSELSVVAMAEVLQAQQSLPPARIVGWWPDSGRHIKVDIDTAVLEEGAAALARTLARGETPREAGPAPFKGVVRAAA